MLLRTTGLFVLVAAAAFAGVGAVTGTWGSAALGAGVGLAGAVAGFVLLARDMAKRPEGVNGALAGMVKGMLLRMALLAAALVLGLKILALPPIPLVAAFFLVYGVTQVVEIKRLARLAALVVLLCAPFAAGAAAEAEPGEEVPYSAVMMHHITDGTDVELPFWHFDFRETFGTLDFTVAGIHFDLTPTRHVLFMLLNGALIFLLFGVYARRRYDERGVPLGKNNLLEALVIFVRDEIAIANIGKKDGPRYVPFLCTLFFFILSMNLLGLIPYGATPTGNLAVTAGLAGISFVVTQIAGMRGQGALGYWAHLVPSGVPALLWPLMLPIEIVGLFTKPFALCVRLFANMTAGHVVILSLLGLIFVQNSLAWVPVSIPFALFIYLLEILVSFLQAYIFAMLTALFIGLASHPH